MDDKELLELAVKAAGYDIQGKVEKMIAEHGHYAGGFVITNSRGGSSAWNPLTDDGDALRLAVKLGITVGPERPDVIGKSLCRVSWKNHNYSLGEYGDGDPYAATRRAIVRAAAEIGKDMK